MATTSATATSLSSSLSLQTPRFYLFSKPTSLFFLPNSKPSILSLSTKISCKKDDIDTAFFDEINPEEEITFDPPEKPEGFVPPRPVDEPPFESEEDIAKAYEKLYGPAYSGESYFGNDIYVMDSSLEETAEFGSLDNKERIRDGFEETVVQVCFFCVF